MVNVNKCKDIWQFYPLLKQMLATNPDGFQEFVEANFENAQDVYNMFEGGVSQDSTSPVLEETEHTDSDSTPQEIQFVPSRPSHTVEETLLDTDTLMLGGARLGILFTDFKRRIVSASILDLQTGEPILNQNKTGVGANEMTGLNRTILNTNIGKYKLELLNKVSKYIGGPVYNTMEEACEVDENGMYKWESTLQEFASRETDTNSPEYMSAREAAVILKQFDNWLASNAPFIRIATPYKDTHLFNPDRYVYVGPSTKMFQSFSSDEYMDAHKYGLSDLVKTIVDVFPEYTEEGKPIPGTQVGVAGMYSIGTKLKHYFQNSGTAETRARWYKGGVNRDWNKLFEDYIRFVNTSKSSASAIAETETDKDITTLTTKMYGLQKLFAILPDDLKILFSHTIDKTVASEYRAAELETTKVGEDTIVYGRAKNYSERPQTTWKSYIKDCVLGASMLLRTTPSMKTALNQKYKIEFKDNSIYVNGKPFVKSTESGWSLVETDHELIKALAQDVLQFPIPEEYSEIHAFFPTAAKDRNSKGMPAWGKLVATVLVNGYAPLNNMMNPQDGNVAEIAKVMSVIYGSESATVVKNQKGNNLPMHQVTCLAYRHLDVVEHMRQLVTEIEDNEDNEDDTSIDRVKSNLIFQNSRQVLTPQCRTDFISGSSRHKTSTSFSKLNARDSLACSMIFDFWKPLFESDTDNYGRIALQAHTYADKSKQLLQRFDLRTPWKIGGDEVNFLSLLQQICNGNKDAIVEMADIWRELEKEQINHTVQNIISDFNEVYGKIFTTIEEVNDFLASPIEWYDGTTVTTEPRSLKSVREDFREEGVPFIENYHAVMFDGKVRINECITTFHKTVNDDALWKDFYTNQFNNFKESAREALIPAAHLFTVKNGDQYTPYDMRGKQEKGKEDYIPLNFVAAAYFLANNIFEGQYNRLMVGDYYLHDNKAKGTTDPSVAAASRYISQIKRMVIYGATTHTYAQGLDNGVKSTVNVAVMEDLPSSVQNMLGETAKMDSCDGSGLTSPYYSRMENNSLLDAAVKDVKKTIMHDIGTNGVPVLLKWAEYAITNEKRRMSYGSDVSYNHIFNKMHSQPVYLPNPDESEDITIEGLSDEEISRRKNVILSKAEIKTVYFRDQVTGQHHKRVIKIVKFGKDLPNLAIYFDSIVDINGKEIESTDSKPAVKPFKTLADLDAIFGGCWSESFNDNNELEYSESSLDEVFDLIVKYDWRDKMIGIVANKSAVKVGVQNLNSADAWTSPHRDWDPLYYFSMSTKFGGLQMDADHDLEDSDVTEMTQMISALVQNGYSIEIADKVYHDIGAYCVESIADIREALKDVDSDKLFQIFGKAIVEAFATGDKDTLGLAQAFIAIATKNMQESGLKPIPFSSMSINGIFNSTVTTTLVKKAIRRHYEGVAAVLNPSFGSIQIYNIEGSTYTYPELLDWYLSHKTIDRNTWSLTQLLNVAEFNGFINPTYKAVDPTTYIDFEDTITWKNDNGTWSSHKVTDYKTYWEARRIVNSRDKVYIKTLAPKNLKGADTKFTLVTTDSIGATAARNSSMFETVYAQLLYATYDIKANTTEDVVNQVKATLADLLGVTNDVVWEETFNVKYKDILVNAFGNLGMNSEYSYKRLRRRLAKSQQKFLGELHKAQENISESNPIYTFNMDGAEYNISSVEVVPAQIIMGRYYAKQFGLSAGDSIGKIRSDENFFFNKAKTQYKTDADSNVDLVLYDGQGDQIHVIYDPDGRKTQSIAGQLSRCNGFTIVDGNVYYKDKLLCKSENKQFYSYKVGDVEHKLVIVSHLNALSDLTKNDWTDYTECLYRQDNAAWILNAVRGKTISENLVTIETKSENGPVVTTVNISTPEGIKSLLEEEKTLKNRHLGHIAFSRKKSFEKSLNFIGTRIPCQSMQSFAPMRVAAFSNSTTNEVFVPTNIMWLEGSDLDIDKQYILGYSIADSGRIFDGEGDHHKEDRLKNNVVDNIWKTVTDPRNQINLTQPISTDDFKAIAAKSSRGKLAEGMSIYNPFHKYSMQVENMVGRDCIGSVATALKGFFALTYMYNMRMNEICDAIESGNIDLATQLFNRYFKQPLANVNVERLDYVLTLLPEGDFKNRLLDLKDKIEDQEDMSMLMGQLLNAATDNAKELILKKINADSTWIDLYTSAFMEGKPLEEVSALMLNPRSQQIFDGFDSSVFAGNRPFGKLPYLTGVKLETKGEDPILDQLIDQAELAEETRVLGRFLKINQGLITNRAEMLAYVGDIQSFVEKRFEKSTNLKEYRKYLNKLNENKELTTKETEELYKLLPDLAHDINTGEGIFEAQQILQSLIADEIRHTQFDVYRFASDSDYRTECIEHYENCKVKFNILEAVATSPHFDKMFGMVSTNEDILTSLSARNRLEGLVVDRYRQQARLENWSNGNINASTAKNLKDRVDDVLRKDWILEQGIEIPIIKGQRYWNGTKFVEAGSTKQTRLAINDEKQILSLRQFLENIVIPLAKEQHPKNKFLSSITMGLQGGIQYWRPMINMSTVSQSIKTKEQYEGMANDFAKLADVNFVVDGIDTGHTIVDWIYLYNLIVNRDRFGATTFTRFFESLVPTGRVDYFAFDFANWLDNIDVEQTFENHRAEFLRYAYEDDPESDTYADHFGIRGKEAIVEDSETFDPWDELKYNSGATDKEIEGYKQRADKLYIVPVVSVNNPSSRQIPEDFSWSGNKQKWIVTFDGSASYQVLSGLKVGDSVTFGKNTVQIQAPLRKWINDGELETVGVAKVQTPVVDAKNLSTPSSFHAFSGAADGADTEWKEVAKLWGIDTTDYTVESYDALDSNWKNTIEEAYQKAVKDLGRFAYGPNTVSGKLVRRDYLQARKADAVFAVGKIVAPGEVGLPNSSGKAYENKTSHDVVDGGTGYAVQMAINMGKPVHVFDPYRKGWYIWNGSSFVKEEVPTLTPKFAAVGSRNLTELPGEEWVRAKLAMRRVFEKTAEKYGWDKSRKAKVDLISFNDMAAMKQYASNIPNGVITTRQSGNQHYGNPFTHRTGTQAAVILPTVKDAAAAYKAWLLGESSFTTSEGKTIDISNVEPERRKWIQNQISSGALNGKTLIYYTTKIGSPNGYKTPDGKTPVYFSDEYPSHAHVLKELVNGRNVATRNVDSNISAETLQQVELIFARNPKLKEVGTPIEYARYIQTIYPNSVDKSVYWHGSDSDFSEGFKTATRGEGSGSPHTKSRNDFYLAKQAWTVLQYVSGVNRKTADKKHGFANWVKLWWELKEIMSNGRRENNDWKDLVIGPENVRQAIPNKAGVFNRDSGGENGKWLKERKADYGYENKSDKEFFEEILGVKWGVDTFNTWTQRNAEIFKSLQTSAKGIYPAVINVINPIRETGQNTYYEEQRGLFTKAEKDGNDAILGAKTDNEFGSDVAVVFDTNNVHFLGTTEDVENFRAWKQSKDSGNSTETALFKTQDEIEHFGTEEQALTTLNSARTILSNAELKQWSEVVDDHPRILVASEHTDPAFHVDAILEVLEGKRKVTHKYVKDGQRVEEQVTGKDLKGLYIITKHDGLPMRKLLETKIPKLVHFSITTLGGTKYEPGVMKYNDLLDRIAEYIEMGLDPNTVTIRIDPIIPGVTNMQDVEIVMARAASMGIKRIKFSVMDAYSNGASNTVENMEKLGYDFEKFYGKNPKNNKWNFNAKSSIIDAIATDMLRFAKKYSLELHTCAENIAKFGIEKDGCLSVDAVSKMLGTKVSDISQQRQLCTCYGGKVDSLRYGDICHSHCVYCYAKHGSSAAMQYYNVDGTLRANPFTDIHWTDEKRDIKAKALRSKTFMLAPNGKPSKLTQQQWIFVRTKEFKARFGDWENDPENASIVIDENGEPKPIYHGTQYLFSDFNTDKLGENTGLGYYTEESGERLEPTTEPIAPVYVEPVVQTDDTTLGIVLNQGQQDAVDGVLKFLNDPTDYEPVIVNGKAGTGKTTIVNEILKKYGKRQSVWIVALSHKAKQVLMDKISLENKDRYNVKGKTIASSQGKTLDFDTGKFADGDTDTNFPAIMFVDEASMVEDEAFAKFLNIAEEHHTKIVFLGDSGQLPPIEENEKGEYKHKPSEISPVFKLSKQSKLTERVRQGEDSPILPYADYYWNYSHKMSKVLPTRADNVQVISSKGALLFDEVLSIPYSFFEKAIKTANPNLIKIVTYTNAVRQELNQRVHERFFGDAVWGKGELVMFFKNYGAGRKMIANSSEAVILEVGSEKPHSAEFDGIYVKINKINLTIKVNGETRQIQVFATPKDKELWNEFLQKFADKISKMPAGREKSSKWRTYYDLRDNTFADIDYSYAITAHKSQGSTYDTVIVNVPDINKMNDVDAARGIYTAITRAKNVAVISGVRTDTPYEDDLLTLNDAIENNKKPKSGPSLSINPEQKSSSETKAQLKELISSINSPYLKEVTDADLEGVDDFTADAEGFVKDGIIYINTDRASVGTVIHELGHLYLGALKSDPEKREHYYDILANIHEYCDLWHEMQGNQFYANKRGSDFDEEIAARLIEMYHNGSIMSERDKALAQELIMISGISLENLPKPEKMQWMSENYKIKQSVATLKNKLYEDEVIKDIDC